MLLKQILNLKILSNSNLKKNFPYPIVTEETPCAYSKRKNWSKYWLVDPLDGTQDFIEKNDEFTINIALIEDQKPILGVVYAPALDILYSGQYKIGILQMGKEFIIDQKERKLIGADSQLIHLIKLKLF